jgi:hypothetical protein
MTLRSWLQGFDAALAGPKGVMIDVEYNRLVDDLKRQARTLMQPPVAALNPETPSRVHDRECAFA